MCLKLIIYFSLLTPCIALSGHNYLPHKVKIITQPSTLHKSYTRLIGEADEILIAHYNWHGDTHGQAVIYNVIEALNRGASVKILIDGFGSDSKLFLSTPLQNILINAGADLRVYKPKKVFTLFPIKKNQGRLHDKILIGDDTLLLGSSNIGNMYFDTNSPLYDINLKVQGSAVANAKSHFYNMFYSKDSKIIKRNNEEYTSEMNKITRSWLRVTHLTEEPEEKIYDIKTTFDDIPLKYVYGKTINSEIIKLLKMATDSIKIITPYPFFSNELKDLLQKKINNGVNIELVIPDSIYFKNEYTGLYGAFLDQINYYKRSGFDIYSSSRWIHAKSILIDSRAAYIGSHNLDVMSFKLNSENGVIIYNSDWLMYKLELDFYNLKMEAHHSFSNGISYLPKDLPICKTNNHFIKDDEQTNSIESNHHGCSPYWFILPRLSK